MTLATLLAIHLWRSNFARGDEAIKVSSVDIVLVRFPDRPRNLRSQFRFVVTPPGSQHPSRLVLTVGEVPAADPGKRLQQRPAHAQTVLLTVSAQFSRALFDCSTMTLRDRDGETLGTRAVTGAERPLDPADDLETIESGFRYDLGKAERVLPDAAAAAWARTHAPLKQFRFPVNTYGDGSASAELSCSIAQDYLWTKRTSTYALSTPRLMLSAPFRTGSRASARRSISAINNTTVETTASFYYLRGKDNVKLFPYTVEFFDTSSSNGGAIGGDGEQNTLVWESTMVFGSLRAEEERDAALLILGVLFALIVQFLAGAAANVWAWIYSRD